MNSASLKTSPRLRRTLAVLERIQHGDVAWISTRALIRAANICAVNSVIAELRDQGCEIETRQVPSPGGERRWEYRLISAPTNWKDET